MDDHRARWVGKTRLAGEVATQVAGRFAHVPWNAPYYARCGFRILDDAEIAPGLQAIRRREAAMGADWWPRVCMRCDL